MPLTRRRFLHLMTGATGGLLAIPGAAQWSAAVALDDRRTGQRVLRIGHVLSSATGTTESAGALGVQLGLEEAQHAARLFGAVVELATDVDAARLIREHRPHVVIGGWTEESCARLSELAASEAMLFFNVGCESDALREACRRNTFHLAPSERMRRAALAEVKATPETAKVVLWHHSLERYGAGQLNPRFRDRFGQAMESDAWAGWMAVKIAAETCFRAEACTAAGLLAELERPTARFDGHKGRPLSFRPIDHQLRQPLYVLRRDTAPSEVTEVPGRVVGLTAAEQLDQLGAPAASSTCKWEK